MKHLVAVALVALLIGLPAQGQTRDREALILGIATLYGEGHEIDADSPFLAETLQEIRDKNEGLSEAQWLVVRQEVAAAIQGMYNRKGGVFHGYVHRMAADMSDAELERLAELMADPVSRKFHRQMTSRQGQQRLLELMMQATLASFGEINEVLRRHGLKEVH